MLVNTFSHACLFELLMAPYTVAHMKLGLQLGELVMILPRSNGYGFI